SQKPRYVQQRAEKSNQDGLVQQNISAVSGNRGPGVRAKQSRSRSQVIAIVAKKSDRSRFTRGIPQPLFHIPNSTFVDPPHQPSANKSATRNRRKIIDAFQQSIFRKPLQNSQIDRRAANSAAGKCQAH